ncbi:CD97 antigen-like [Scleropages formosus]|uniref:CD97 antigen-like n=1 Tax=Scleropages formosus TaxID=113540 RepID=A0A8C9SHH9_SCLFO|nr:CD97 antigen-like [Scleropages formosus]
MGSRVYLLLLGLLMWGSCNVQCPPGFQTKQFGGSCEDMDECTISQGICGNNAKCYNTNGSYYCQCEHGYRAKSFNFTSSTGQCKDINECIEEPKICGLNAECRNTIGSYSCSCISGYNPGPEAETVQQARNITCVDIDECSITPDICGQNAYCRNTNGHYDCQCQPGFISTSGNTSFTNGTGKCVDLKCDQYTLDTATLQSSPNFQEMQNQLRNTCLALATKSAAGQADAVTFLKRLLTIVDEVLKHGPLDDSWKVSKLLSSVEDTVQMISLLLSEPETKMDSAQTVVQILKSFSTQPQGSVMLSSEHVKLDTQWETTEGYGFTSICLVSYNHLESSTNNSFHGMSNFSQGMRYKLVSKVVSAKVSNPNTAHLEKPIFLTFSLLKSALQSKKGSLICVYWDEKLSGGGWSEKGCSVSESNGTHTICSCTHLSSFAVLMALYDIEEKFQQQLQMITWVGLSLSLVCLFLCIITFSCFRSIKGTRNTIHLNLCISLFAADFIFLIGITKTEPMTGCGIAAALLHFLFLSAFCWMCLEGVQLYRMVVLVFHTELKLACMLAAGYGIPIVIVGISAAVNWSGYGTEKYCWLSRKDHFIWSFFGPVCAIIAVNTFFFVLTIQKLVEKFSSLNPELSNLQKIKTFTVTAIAQLCILGLMWIFGCFMFQEGTIAMVYLFTIFNSLQGVLVFLMHCLLTKQVRNEYRRLLTSICSEKKYSEFSSNQSSKSQASKSVQHTGESKM